VDAERLAAYLAGELDADEIADVESALARDPALRADLDAMRRADEALAAVPPTELPEGVERRLHAAVGQELTKLLASDAPAVAPADELAARRARRRWVPALAAAAAGVALLAVIGIGLTGAGDDAGTDEVAMSSLDEADSDDAGAAEAALPLPGDAPTVVAGDRDLDDAAADDLLASEELRAVTVQELDAELGSSLAGAWRSSLAAVASDAPVTEEAEPFGAEDLDEDTAADDGDAAEDTETAEDAELGRGAEPAGPLRLLADAPLTDDDRQAVSRCVAELVAGDSAAVPAYVELGSYLGDPAVIVGLVTLDPATDAYTRAEVWVLDRDDCQVRRFSQA
jgi:hypothetical protein